MKHNKFWLLIIIFTIVFGVVIMLFHLEYSNTAAQKLKILPESALLSDENVLSNLPVLNYCELVNNNEKYNGKIVRLRATINFGLEGSWFSDAACSGGIDSAAMISSKNDKVWRTIEQARGSEDLLQAVDLIVVGKFSNVVYDYGGLKTPFQFEIIRVEKTPNIN